MSKKILVVYAKSTLELSNRQSALGSYIFCLCELLQKNGMDISINGTSFHQLKQQKSSGNTAQQPGGMKKYLPVAIKEFIKDILVFKKISKLFKQIKISGTYDCVLEFYTYGSNVGYKISSLQKIPLLLIYDSPVLEEYVFFYGKKYFFSRLILKRELKSLLSAKSIVAYSNAVKAYLNKLAAKKLDIFIHQNVDFTRFDFLEKKFEPHTTIKIGFIGSFLKWHQIDLLVEAFCKLKKENYPVELFLVGYGVEYESIKKLVDTSEYKQFITMTGFLDGDQLVEVKKKLQLGIMPGSNWYGAPNKIFEYAAAKIAVIAPDTPTIVDLFEDKKELLLFKQGNVDELAEKLKMLCNDLMLTEQLARSIQEKIKQNYSEKNTLEFYSKLLS